MAEFMDVSELEDSIREIESDVPMNDEIETDVLPNVGQNFQETGTIQFGVAGAFKEKFKLLRMGNELHEISRIFFPLKFSLLDIKHDKRNDLLASMSKEYTIYLHEIQKMFEYQETTINLLQLKFKLLELKHEKRDDLFIGKMIYDQMNYLLGIQKSFKEKERTVKTIKLEELSKAIEKTVEDTEMEEVSKDTKQIVEETGLEKISKDTEKIEETKSKELSKNTNKTLAEQVECSKDAEKIEETKSKELSKITNKSLSEQKKSSNDAEKIKETKSKELSKEKKKAVAEQEERSKDAEELVEETFDCFLRYLDAFKNCAFFIADTFDEAAENNSYLMRSIQILFDSISTLEEYMESYKAFPGSSKTASDTNESSTNNDPPMTVEDLFNKIDHLLTVTEQAEFAYNEIRRLVFELVTFE